MPVVATKGAEVWYDDRGSGEPVLLVHGGLFDRMDGERFWVRPGIVDDLVGAGYRVLVPDRRFGSGRTSADYAVHTWQRDAADMAAVLDDAGVPAAHVVTGSNGCTVVIHLGLARPQMVRALVLCWPGLPDNVSLRDVFERAARKVETLGSSAYLEWLREHGVPHPTESRPGFPFGNALVRDERAERTFRACTSGEAARVMRESAAQLLTDGVLRGVSESDAHALSRIGPAITVLPANPEDEFHTRAAAEQLEAAIPGARLAPGTAVSPAPGFAEQRASFLTQLSEAFALP